MFRNHPSDRQKIKQNLGYTFKDEKLLLQALTRTSALGEGLQAPNIGDFQRLEFIGDRVLNLVISDLIFDNHPDWKEGELTVEVSKWVNNKGPLADIARNLQLGEFLIMGRGEDYNSLRDNSKVLSDAFEALLGALWLDSEKDFKLLRSFVLKQYQAIGLRDFNKDYEAKVLGIGMKVLQEEILEDIMPDIYGPGGGEYGSRGVSLSTLISMKFQASQRQAKGHKSLKGISGAFEKALFLNQSKKTEEDEDAKSDDSLSNLEF